ncbi:MAG: YicC family protein [bacterium]|nr:YicC family protein [bacterium]
MLSMTGFGNGEKQLGPITVTVELRSVNHRFLDVGLKLYGSLATHEMEIRQFLKENVSRGRVTVTTQLVVDKASVDASLDPERLAQGIGLLKDAAQAVTDLNGEPQAISLDHLLAIPDILRPREVEIPDEDIKTTLMAALQDAHKGLMQTKKDEGDALVLEMKQRLETLSTNLADVEKLAPLAGEQIKAKLEERLAKILDEPLDPQRQAQEIALLADKANINEETERLGIHIQHFHTALDSGGQVAKRLNFLLQEMHREVNTMGSKTNLMDITQSVITMKDEVESMREQIMNLE